MPESANAASATAANRLAVRRNEIIGFPISIILRPPTLSRDGYLKVKANAVSLNHIMSPGRVRSRRLHRAACISFAAAAPVSRRPHRVEGRMIVGVAETVTGLLDAAFETRLFSP